MVETTLVLFKPDCVERKLCGTVLSRFEQEGFQIVGLKMMVLDEEILREHYEPLQHEPFFPGLLEFMLSGPVLVLGLKGENAIKRVRDIIGITDPSKAEPGTIRNEYGTNTQRNIAHASDSSQAAHDEMQRFFAPEQLLHL